MPTDEEGGDDQQDEGFAEAAVGLFRFEDPGEDLHGGGEDGGGEDRQSVDDHHHDGGDEDDEEVPGVLIQARGHGAEPESEGGEENPDLPVHVGTSAVGGAHRRLLFSLK